MNAEVLMGLGGNIGDPQANMRAALKALDAEASTRVEAVSRLFRTPPWGKTNQPWFYNACARLSTGLEPHALLDLFLAVERRLKRERGERWGPRTIDLDLLDHGGRTVADEWLELPHPRMHLRAFVVVPLRDIAPDYEIAGERVETIAERIDATGVEPVTADGAWWRQGSVSD